MVRVRRFAFGEERFCSGRCRFCWPSYFFHERQAGWFVFCLFFFFENWLYTATYIADARAMVLPLVTTGDPDFVEHDWNTIFSSLGVLRYDTAIAGSRANAGLVRHAGLRGMASRLAFELRRRTDRGDFSCHSLWRQVPGLAIKMRRQGEAEKLQNRRGDIYDCGLLFDEFVA